MDLSGISETVDDCLYQDFFSGENAPEKAVSIGHSRATKSDFRATKSIHFTW